MNIRKNRSGNWQVRIMIDGVNYCTTIKGKKPTEKQAYDKIMEKVEKANKPYDSSISFAPIKNRRRVEVVRVPQL